MAVNNPNTFNLTRLRESLAPFRFHFFPSLRSTNDHAAAMRRDGKLFAPAIVLAARQTAGRGRGANTWFSSAGSITVTFVLAADPALAAHHVPLAAGLAVRNAVASIARRPDIGLKWPNDLVVPATGNSRGPLKKLAGLLCERMDNIDLVGLGLNVNRPPKVPPDLAQRAACLQELAHPQPARGTNKSSRPFFPPLLDLTDTLIHIAREIHQVLIRKTQTPFGLLLREYDQHHLLLGRTLTIFVPHEPPITGRCEGLDDTGRLLLKVGRRVVPIVAGHVELRS